MLTKRLLATLVLLSLSAIAAAQEHPNFARGLSAPTDYESGDLDSINLYNGNLHLTIPIGHAYPLGGGTAYGFGLHYNSNVWDYEDGPTEGGQPTTVANVEPYRYAGLGWNFGLGRVFAPFSGPLNQSSSWLLLEPDGTRRIFSTTLHAADPVVTGFRYTRDGSYLRMQDLAVGEHKVESADGTARIFRADGLIRQVTDQFGNFVNVTYPDGTTWVLTDSTAGRRRSTW